MKLTWRVQEAPTGQFRSFHYRGWPSAEVNGKQAAIIRCADSYVPRNAKTGKHSPLKVAIADHRALSNPGGGGFCYRTLSGEFATLPEAKAAAERFLTANPHFLER